MEGKRYPGDCRVACLIYLSYPLHSICVGLNANVAVVILQTYCQMKLHRSPCSVTPCFNNDIATTFWAEIVFFLWVPWFNVRLQWFWRASSIPFFLHLSKSFSVMTFSPFSSSLHWLKSEVIFSLISWTEFGSSRNLWFFCVIFFRLFMKAKSSSRKGAFFSWWWPNAFTPTSTVPFTSELGPTVSLNCSNFAVGCDRNRILKTIKNWVFFGKLDGCFRTKT